jgi:hypothetical protein
METLADAKRRDRDARKDLWDVNNRALNALMVAQGAGLVTCLTLLKDYDDKPQLKGVGIFIALFGLGLVTAIASSFFLLISRPVYLKIPDKRDKDHRTLIWMTKTWIVLAHVSLVILIVAILVAVYEFSSL